MVRMETGASARSRRQYRNQGGFEGYRTDFLTSDSTQWPAPQVMLIEQNPLTVVRSHFHDRHQFQVFVAGSGTMGRHQLPHGTVHYSSMQTPYGPITAGSEGLSYFTMRAVSTPAGAFYMPESRGRMHEGRRAHQAMATPPLGNAAERRARTQPLLEPVIQETSDGLAAWIMRLPPGGKRTVAPADAAGGRFLLAVAGNMVLNDSVMASPTVIWNDPDEAFAVTSGEDGLDLLVMQFPRDVVQR